MAAPDIVPYSDAEKSDIARIETYLNGIETLQARFLQISSNGGQSQGTLSLWRPGRLRLVYDPPVPLEIIADGFWLFHHDKEMKQVNQYFLRTSPASILLDEKISFSSGELTISKFVKSPGVLRLTLAKGDDPEGSMTLIFSDSPLTLRKWVITDVQGVETIVSLIGSRFGLPFDPDLFKFHDPYGPENSINR